MQSQVQRTRDCPRRYLWRGFPGQSFATTVVEKEAILTSQNHVLRPMPVLDLDIKQMNMKSYIGSVIQLAHNDGTVIESMLAYGHLIDAMKCNTEWIIIAEYNKDNVFHVHALCKNNFRTDSWRRSIGSAWNIMSVNPKWIEEFGTGATMDCLKCQKAHKPGALLEYMTKAPVWIVGNTDRILQIAYDMVNWDMGSRFRGLPEPKAAPDLDKANPMIADLLGAITAHNCKTVEEVMRKEPEMVLKYLHRPGFSAILQNCLTYAKCTKSAWKITSFAHHDCNPAAIHAVLLHQGIDVDRFDLTFYRWVTKQNGKKNTICIEGPSNTGKTSFFTGFRQICPTGEIVNGQSFNYEGLIDCYAGVWDEPLCADEQAEKFKQIAGGEPCSIPVKHKKPYALNQIPIIITTNRPFWFWCPTQEMMFRNRFEIYKFKFNATDRFYPRSCSRSCECCYCLVSSGRTISTSSSTTSGMQGKEQSTQSMAAGDGSSTSAMGSGPVRTGGKYTRKSATGRKWREGSTSRESGSSSSTTISNIGGSDTEYGSSDPNLGIHSTRTRDEQHVGRSDRCSGSHGHDYCKPTRTDRSGNAGSGRDSEQSKNVPTMVSVGGSGNTQSEMEDAIQTKKPRLVGEMGTMKVPTRQNWEMYLSYLYHIYEKKPIDLTCYESLSDEDDG
ncbi:nonstructural protein 1 [Chestnut teal chaphamaparvovirus 2]|uniref:Nonstructural protein 1 n=1 Tax=Chestnut teal chaphamaparvovirus 2 TaxID=2759404 RepID=A0A7D7B5M2_9VIRU|nr:nonstructural protein 1 [Chestnut teal chaphamaparvovirus 2]QMI57833.1 nonstructural protein 1 [Chestnut teal chaphamaparvovirus 2]